MSLRKTSRRRHGTMTELNITPLLDLVPKVEPTRIEVSGQGQISLDQQPVTAVELKEKLTVLKAADPELGVVVKGADDTDYQVMVGVLDTLRQLDITKMGMATE
ncbi:MAG: biopolymer transporter ExbD [Verrucomicrobia bacterium]|nr:biopolymer transporter ExbD [Verrucomicrobiota bacterium]